jgi:putative acyl-CoA dehydrogenase
MAATETPRTPSATHEVTNQSVPLENYNVYSSDRVLVEAVRREGASPWEDRITALGEIAGRAETKELAVLANEHGPVLKTHDRFGHRLDEVEFHPAWHRLMEISVGAGVHALPWREPEPGAHAARAALEMVAGRMEGGHLCPISMTYAVVPALRKQPELAAEWEPRIESLAYDPSSRPAAQKRGALFGMGMTEKQGGSDVRSNLTTARPVNGGGPGAEYEVTGHKWFMSCPQNDAFLVLAQTDAGVSCFLMPRIFEDGSKNHMYFQRLKDKLGNRSNASSEVEFRGALARLVGEEGRGVPTIIEMVNHTRLDCVVGTASGMRAGVEAATWHAAHRAAFGKQLIDQPLMRNVLADLAIESEAATIAGMRLARAYDNPDGSESETLFKRLATAVVKYWVCKRAPGHAYEALECHGGNGYVEESGMPRLYREAPLASIWEGSGNVMALDVLRALVKSPATLEAFFAEVGEGAGADPRLDGFVNRLRSELSDPAGIEERARRIVEHMALALQASLLVRFGDEAVADAYCASRLAGDGGLAYGTLPAGTDFGRIIERHAVAA